MKTLIYFLLLFYQSQSLRGESGIYELRGNSRYIRANGNTEDNLSREIRTMDFSLFVGTGEDLVVRSVNFKIPGLEATERAIGRNEISTDTKFAYRCDFVVEGHKWDAKTHTFFSQYINLRLTGCSSIGAMYVLGCWFKNPDVSFPDSILRMPVEKFRKIETIPASVDIFLNRGYPKDGAEYYIFADGDLFWLLEGTDKTCRFILGMDAKHFDSAGFEKDFALEAELFEKGEIDEDSCKKISDRLKQKWNIAWYWPHYVPVPAQ